MLVLPGIARGPYFWRQSCVILHHVHWIRALWL